MLVSQQDRAMSRLWLWDETNGTALGSTRTAAGLAQRTQGDTELLSALPCCHLSPHGTRDTQNLLPAW